MARLIKKQRIIISNDGMATVHCVIRTVKIIKESNYQGFKGGLAKINNHKFLVEQKTEDGAWYGDITIG